MMYTGMLVADLRAMSAQEAWASWGRDPVVLGGLTFAAIVYACGLLRLWGRAGQGRGVSRVRAFGFYAGLGFLGLALASPLDAWAEVLFSAHMVQHLVLVTIVAPCLVLGRAWIVGLWSMPADTRGRMTRVLHTRPVWAVVVQLRRPAMALLAHACVLWIWHWPAAYEAALAVPALHALEHLSFLGTAMLFWGATLHGRANAGGRMMVLFAGATQGVLLGAFITLAPTAWYSVHHSGAEMVGLSRLEDQQIAGLIMWVPGGIAYLIAALTLFAAWLRQAERWGRRCDRQRTQSYGVYFPRVIGAVDE